MTGTAESPRPIRSAGWRMRRSRADAPGHRHVGRRLDRSASDAAAVAPESIPRRGFTPAHRVRCRGTVSTGARMGREETRFHHASVTAPRLRASPCPGIVIAAARSKASIATPKPGKAGDGDDVRPGNAGGRNALSAPDPPSIRRRSLRGDRGHPDAGIVIAAAPSKAASPPHCRGGRAMAIRLALTMRAPERVVRSRRNRRGADTPRWPGRAAPQRTCASIPPAGTTQARKKPGRWPGFLRRQPPARPSAIRRP